jgi:hypothetical protein
VTPRVLEAAWLALAAVALWWGTTSRRPGCFSRPGAGGGGPIREWIETMPTLKVLIGIDPSLEKFGAAIMKTAADFTDAITGIGDLATQIQQGNDQLAQKIQELEDKINAGGTGGGNSGLTTDEEEAAFNQLQGLRTSLQAAKDAQQKALDLANSAGNGGSTPVVSPTPGPGDTGTTPDLGPLPPGPDTGPGTTPSPTDPAQMARNLGTPGSSTPPPHQGP